MSSHDKVETLTVHLDNPILAEEAERLAALLGLLRGVAKVTANRVPDEGRFWTGNDRVYHREDPSESDKTLCYIDVDLGGMKFESARPVGAAACMACEREWR